MPTACLRASRLLVLLLPFALAGCPEPAPSPRIDSGATLETDAPADVPDVPDVPVDTPDEVFDATSATDVLRDAGVPVDAVSDIGSDASPPPRCTSDGGIPTGTRVRIAAANLTSGNFQTYEGPGVRIFQGLRPDVVMIQEFRASTGTLRALVDTAFGTSFQFFVESPSATGIPNGVVSRFPILEAGEWDDPRASDRDFVWARIDVPGPIDLWVFSVHLLRSSADVRAMQATDLLARIAARVPSGDYVAVGGDFNSNVETEPVLAVFGRTLRVGPPFPVDPLGNNRTSGNRSRPYDWVLASATLAALEVPLRAGDFCYPQGVVFDSRVFSPLSDFAPVLADDSAATNMQHMLVARDYVIP